jgi:hypothetical protein
MAIDVETPESPGWWLQKLAKQLEAKQKRLGELRSRYEGDAPLPPGPEGEARRAYEPFWRKARTNYAELIVEALRQRLKVTGFRTAAGGDENGDEEARRINEENAFDVLQADVTEFVLSMGEAYTITGLDPVTQRPVTTAEDPRQVITIHDPVTGAVRAGLKMFHDDDLDRDYAFVYLPGVAAIEGSREVAARVYVGYFDRKQHRARAPKFTPRAWSWDEDRGGAEGEPLIGAKGNLLVRPTIVRFLNRRGVAEFEPHVDVLDRLDHGHLQRMVIATMQAFRQRAIKGAKLKDPTTGEEIPWDELLAADPGSVWLLPGVVEMWESGQVDLTGVLSASKDDLRELAAVTQTPLATFMPGEAAQTAEGATFQREGLVFKAGDRMVRLTPGWKEKMAFEFEVLGDLERADRSQIEVLWASPERRSLAEMADAWSKTGDLPFPTRAQLVLGSTPSEIGRMQSERAQDALQQALLAPAQSEPVRRPEPAA